VQLLYLVSVQAYPVTVGGGGAGGCGQTPLPQGTKGVPGSNSIFSTITSALEVEVEQKKILQVQYLHQVLMMV
jgi:hypothetical protein